MTEKQNMGLNSDIINLINQAIIKYVNENKPTVAVTRPLIIKHCLESYINNKGGN